MPHGKRTLLGLVQVVNYFTAWTKKQSGDFTAAMSTVKDYASQLAQSIEISKPEKPSIKLHSRL